MRVCFAIKSRFVETFTDRSDLTVAVRRDHPKKEPLVRDLFVAGVEEGQGARHFGPAPSGVPPSSRGVCCRCPVAPSMLGSCVSGLVAVDMAEVPRGGGVNRSMTSPANSLASVDDTLYLASYLLMRVAVPPPRRPSLAGHYRHSMGASA